MFLAFAILFVAAIIVCFVGGRLDKGKLCGAGAGIGLVAGILLVIAINGTPTKSNVNPFFLGTFLLIMCAGVPMGIGYNLGESIRKKALKKRELNK